MAAPDRPTTGVTPYLSIREGRANEVLEFYGRAFAGKIIERTYAQDAKRLFAKPRSNSITDGSC